MSTPARDAARYLLRAVPLTMRMLGAELRQMEPGLRPAHLRMMGMLYHKGQCNLSAMAEHQVVSKPTMTNTINTLEERGWVRRVRSADDRRVVLVELTDAGREVLACDVLGQAGFDCREWPGAWFHTEIGLHDGYSGTWRNEWTCEQVADAYQTTQRFLDQQDIVSGFHWWNIGEISIWASVADCLPVMVN